MKFINLLFLLLLLSPVNLLAQDQSIRDYGIEIGVLPPGEQNAITDVEGVQVGHQTIVEGDNVRTGVTAILPHDGNIFQHKVPAAVHIGNGFGKLAGSTQIEELGNLETPVILTNTLSVPTAADALIDHTFSFSENDNVRSVNPVVGETNDGYLNDIRGRHVSKKDVLTAIENAKSGNVEQGNVGAGTGTIAFGFKGGIGTSSRKLPNDLEGYSIGVLVQSNFGGVLQIAGVPIGKELDKYYLSDELNETPNGSCMIIVATDAPLDARNLERLAKRAILGMGKTGGIASNGSGDYVIAFSTAESVRIPYNSEQDLKSQNVLRNSAMSPLFMAVNEATEEAIINSLFHAETITGRDGHTVKELPVEQVLKMMEKSGRDGK
ncbi:aminopeptidase [Aliifodinibius salipaludis]|uniref:Aminopeptidase n=1 Tax=Fodinibius salipaludis TaxID=2032627 RepID=A0A2A2GE87_9BACT|nr:P1 family peptidase [Aliifodinibius salipaludis]PAU95227.1 aminopeptidase [Aliifodinibius salipaludis]